MTAAPLGPVTSCLHPLQLDPGQSTHCSLYGLQTNVIHEMRVRCKMLGGKEFGGFSDSVFIHIPSRGKDLLACRAALPLSASGGTSCVTSAPRHNNRRKTVCQSFTATGFSHWVGKKFFCWILLLLR